jgi:hypothetical protein
MFHSMMDGSRDGVWHGPSKRKNKIKNILKTPDNDFSDYISKVLKGAYTKGIYYFIHDDFAQTRKESINKARWNGHLPLSSLEKESKTTRRRGRRRHKSGIHPLPLPVDNSSHSLSPSSCVTSRGIRVVGFIPKECFA